MSDSLYIRVYNFQDELDQPWVGAEVLLNGNSVAVGSAPERPPYVEGTARSSAISRAQIDFSINVLGADLRNDPGFVEKKVKGPS